MDSCPWWFAHHHHLPETTSELRIPETVLKRLKHFSRWVKHIEHPRLLYPNILSHQYRNIILVSDIQLYTYIYIYAYYIVTHTYIYREMYITFYWDTYANIKVYWNRCRWWLPAGIAFAWASACSVGGRTVDQHPLIAISDWWDYNGMIKKDHNNPINRY